MKNLKPFCPLAALLCVNMAASAQFTVSCVARDAKGEPPVGAAISEKGTAIITAAAAANFPFRRLFANSASRLFANSAASQLFANSAASRLFANSASRPLAR